MKLMVNLFIVFNLTISVETLIAANPSEGSKSAELEKAACTLESVVRTLDNFRENPVNGIPQSLINKSEGIVIFPGACKVAAGPFNAAGGRGVAVVHNEDGSWSNPFFVTLREGSQGFQIGGPTSDIVLLFKDRSDIKEIYNAEITLGGDIGEAAGPVENGSTSIGDISFKTDIYSYHRIKGLFTGASSKGSVLSFYENLSDSLYGIDDINMNEFFNEIDSPYNDQVNDLIAVLNTYGG